MLLTADLHLRPESEETVFAVFDALEEEAKRLGDDDLVILGDLYHLRYQVPIALQNRLVERLRAWPGDVTLLPGNHDQCDEAGRNALEVLGHIYNIHVYNEPVVYPEGCWLPYRKQIAEYQPFLKKAKKDKVKVGFCHHGLVGAMMNSHKVAGEGDGIPPAWFANFDVVFFGHWHRHQQIGNCVYVGSPWQTRADEADQEKGFVYFDGEHWSFHPLRVGRSYHRIPTDGGLHYVQPGDKVILSVGQEALAEEARQLGAEVVLEKPTEKFEARFALPSGAGARDYAEAYVKERGGDLDPKLLMQVFDEITA